MTDRFPDFLNPAIDSSGNTLSGAKLEFFITGTSTPKDTYTSSAKTTPNANPVIADSGGRFPEIFMDTDAAYKVTLSDADDVLIWTKDPVYPVRANPVADINTLSKSADYPVLTTDKGAWINVDASSGPVTVTLPTVAAATNGFFVYVKKTDSSANVVTIDGSGAETIDGSTTFPLPGQYDTMLVVTNGTTWQAFQVPIVVPFPPEYQNGLALTADAGDAANDVNIAPGKARDGDDTENIVVVAEFTKQANAAWVVGDDAGGLDTGGIANDNRYYIWLIKRTDTDVEDALFSLSSTAPTMPTNYTKKRLIGYFDRVAGSNTQLTKINTSGNVIQVVTVQDGDVATGTTTIPTDDTIPQNTEGDEYMAVTITPTNASNILEIRCVVHLAHTINTVQMIVALFQDSTAGALAAVTSEMGNNNALYQIVFTHRMTSGTVSETTFKIRAGPGSAGTTTFNGTSGARFLGGVLASSITVTEIQA